MHVRYKSMGAAKTVTGSRHLIEIDDYKLLLDCGLFQGLKDYRLRNWEDFPIAATEIDAVILSHAHIDHSGYLPKLVREGFSGPIYCTDATADLLEIMLLDSAKLQEEEAEWANKKGYSRHKKALPLYTVKDAEKVFPMLAPLSYEHWLEVDEKIRFRFLNAGHILGAAITEIVLTGDREEKTLIYSGDLGRQEDPIMFEPVLPGKADIVLFESTYGDRDNDFSNAEGEIARAINETCETGCLIIPAFSVGRTQNMLYYIRKLMLNGSVPEMPVYIDSPMAISVTDLYRKHSNSHRLGAQELENEASVFDFHRFNYIRNRVQSAMINEVDKKAIIISASGMCTGGRILHHLFHRLPRETDAIMIVGFQAEGSRGRAMVDGEKHIKIFGQQVEVKARIYNIHGLSAHADRNELMAWLKGLEDSPKMAFTVHGELHASQKLAAQISEELEWNNVFIPGYLENFELFNGI